MGGGQSTFDTHILHKVSDLLFGRRYAVFFEHGEDTLHCELPFPCTAKSICAAAAQPTTIGRKAWAKQRHLRERFCAREKCSKDAKTDCEAERSAARLSGTAFVIQREYVPKFIFAISHCVCHKVARHKQLSSRSSSYHEPSLLMILRSASDSARFQC